LEGLLDQSAIAPATKADLAAPADEPEIRRLLREQAIGGEVRVCMCREPDLSLSARVEGERATGVVIRRAGRVVGYGCRSVRPLWINGQRCDVGYAGSLRRDPALVGHVRLLRDGWRIFDAERRPEEATFDLTSIVADNDPARRLLERGIPGMPLYLPVARLESLICRARSLRHLSSRRAAIDVGACDDSQMPAVAAFLQLELSRFQFAPCWTLADLAACGLTPADIIVARRQGRIVGVMAVWDQRAFKQIVIDGYTGRPARWRAAINCAAVLLGRPRLPAIGQTLNMAHLSHWAVADDDPVVMQLLFGHAARRAIEKGIELLLFGITHDHPLFDDARSILPGVPYSSGLYVVHRGSPPRLDRRPTCVEAALL